MCGFFIDNLLHCPQHPGTRAERERESKRESERERETGQGYHSERPHRAPPLIQQLPRDAIRYALQAIQHLPVAQYDSQLVRQSVSKAVSQSARQSVSKAGSQ